MIDLLGFGCGLFTGFKSGLDLNEIAKLYLMVSKVLDHHITEK